MDDIFWEWTYLVWVIFQKVLKRAIGEVLKMSYYEEKKELIFLIIIIPIIVIIPIIIIIIIIIIMMNWARSPTEYLQGQTCFQRDKKM